MDKFDLQWEMYRFWRKITNPFHKAATIIGNYWHYKKVIAADRTFNFYYMIGLIEAKLRRDLKFYKSDDTMTDTTQEVEQMEDVLRAIEWYRDAYGYYVELFEKRFGKPIVFMDLRQEFDEETGKGRITAHFDEDKDEYEKRAAELYKNKATKLENASYRMIFDTMRKYGRNWWD